MIKSAAGARLLPGRAGEQARPTQTLVRGDHRRRRAGKGDPRLQFRRVMFNMARRQAGQSLRRRDTREHVALYLKAFNAWRTDQPLAQLRFTPRESMPRIGTTR